MAREYAVRNAAGEILFATPGFDAAAQTETLALSGGAALCLAGEDELRAACARLEERLAEAESANAAKELFLSNMSHDIRTPMNAIVGMTALAKRHLDEKARVADSLDKIEVASAHLLSLINEVLDMSRINSGKLSISRELFSLGDLLHDVLTIVRPQAAQRGHRFLFSLGEVETEALYGDALRLRQIFVNIISNAVKYTPEGGDVSVSVSVEREGERCLLRFRCRDNGVGMTPEFLRRIFDPFERAGSTTVSRVEGAGLGMSIVKKLLDAMDSSIDIDSAPGEGTDVRICVPLRGETLPLETAALEGRRLLVVEADEKLAETYRRYLGEAGLDFALASGSAEAFAALADADISARRFSAVVLGRQLAPGDRLLELAEYLHGSDPSLPLILVSDCSWEEIEYRANRCGIETFIPVPFFRTSLINALNRALRDSSAESSSSFDSLDLSRRRILLVDDNEINREIAVALLEMTGAQIETAVDGKDALERYLAAPEGSFDLILMDIQMPVMDGYAAARAIRASGRADAEKLRIFAMTANAFAEDVAKAREAGMDGHLSKPIDVNRLFAVLKSVE